MPPAGCRWARGRSADVIEVGKGGQMAGADPGMAISGLSDTGVSPGRRFQPLILGLAVAIWALTHFTGHDSRDPSGLTLAHQPAHSSASDIARTPPSVARLRRDKIRSGSGQGGHPAITQKAELYPIRSHREDRAVNDRLSWLRSMHSVSSAANDSYADCSGAWSSSSISPCSRQNWISA